MDGMEPEIPVSPGRRGADYHICRQANTVLPYRQEALKQAAR